MTAFRWLWASKAVDDLGTAATVVVLPLLALSELAASPFEVSVLVAVGMAPDLLFGLQVGVWLTGRDAVRVSVFADLARAVLLASIPAAAMLDGLSLAQLYVVAFVVGGLTLVSDVTAQAMLPGVVPAASMVPANGRLQTTHASAQVVGPGLGGLLVARVGAAPALLFDVLSYLASAALLSRVRPAVTVPGTRANSRTSSAVREGLAYLVAEPLLGRVTAVAAGITFFLSGYAALAVVFLRQDLALTPLAVGVLAAASGVGAVIGAVAAAPLAARIGTARAALAAVTLLGLTGLMIPASGPGVGVALYVAGALGVGIGVTIFNTIIRAFRQTYCPAELLTRVLATVRFLALGLAPLGALAAGVLAQLATTRTALTVFLALNATSAVMLLLSPLRLLRDLPRRVSSP